MGNYRLPSVCRICGAKIRYVDNASGRCENCEPQYRKMLQNVPQEWRDVTGGSAPYYWDWEEAESINKRLFDGKIIEEQADAEFDALYKKITEARQEKPVRQAQTHWELPLRFPPNRERLNS